jgi:outer membrane receptor protein involved in Fe transport
MSGKYALNGVTRYSFPRDSFLRGWSVGGNFRWRSAPVVGYERIIDPVTNRPSLRKDVSKPIEGVSTFDLGAMVSYETRIKRRHAVRFQLNVQNLLDKTDPVLMGMDSDTYGVYGVTDAYVPIRYTLVRPRNFVFSAKYTF